MNGNSGPLTPRELATREHLELLERYGTTCASFRCNRSRVEYGPWCHRCEQAIHDTMEADDENQEWWDDDDEND